MARRPPKSLSDAERELWKKVVARTARLHPERPAADPEKQALTQANSPKKPPKPPAFRLGETARPTLPAHDIAPSLPERLASQPVAMDRKRYGQMRKGRLTPEARIDLHGMTIAQAHPALTRFILDAVAREARLVLVITGKGKTKPDHGPIPERHGVLRHNVPHWLSLAPLRPHVLQVTEAHVKHGGQGAYYVYLRRNR